MHEARSAYPCPYGDYVLLERLGVGGMSQVDLARKAVAEAEFVRFLVIKRIKADRTDDDAFVRMFKDEARITSELHHANVAQVYDFGRVGDEYFMALEFVPGLDARKVINTLRERGKRVPLRVALRVVCDVLEGLQYAHTKVDQRGRPMEIVHRDVNPRNIMISVRGEVKLIDFGVAKATGRLERTRTDHVKGKFAYMAPEQVRADDVDHRADLFAVGLTLHEFITGYGPFHGLGQVQIMHRLLSGRIPPFDPPPELVDVEPLRRVHAKALECDPQLRYQSARDFRDDLEDVAAGIGGLATQEEMVQFLQRVAPDLVDDVQAKIESFSGDIDVSHLHPGPVHDRELEGSMSGVVAPSAVETGTGSGVARTGILAGGLFLGAFGGVVLMAIGVAAIVYAVGLDRVLPGDAPDDEARIGVDVDVDEDAATGPAGGDADAPDADAPDAPDAAPATVEGSADPPAGSNAASSRPSPSAAAKTPNATRPATAAPEPPPADAGPDAASTAEPDAPAPLDAAPAAEPAPDADTDGGADAEPTAFGTLQVASLEKGRPIRIDGKDTGEVTPARVEVGVGTHEVVVEGYEPVRVEILENHFKTVLFK